MNITRPINCAAQLKFGKKFIDAAADRLRSKPDGAETRGGSMSVPRMHAHMKALCAVIFAGILSAGFILFSVEAHAEETRPVNAAKMQWWQDARFGLFIHWGPVSLKGSEIGWSRGGIRPAREGAIESRIPQGSIPTEVYDTLYEEFNPTRFDAGEWVQLAKDAGMKYLVFTTKHHDGFVNFDSKLTDYRITSPKSPFRRDIVAELAAACHSAGLGLGFYYSQPDWHHPDYRTENHDRYIEYLHGQVRELCTGYGKVDIMWFDGLGSEPEAWDAENLLAMIRELQPGVLINNRAGLPADFDTPEQRVGSFKVDRPWETCMTIGTQWAWKPADQIKSAELCIKNLVRTAGGGGNFLFNVGPMPDGQIEAGQAERLREMGEWLAQYGEAIYETRGGPFKPGRWGASTHRGNRIFVHVFNFSGETLRLPPIGKEIVQASLLTGGKVKVKQTMDGITIRVAEEDRQDIDTIIVLELDGPASKIAPVER